MSTPLRDVRPSAEEFARIFETECRSSYPEIDALEYEILRDTGRPPIDRDRLESAARVLACPLKVNPPNWQHGRLIYALSVGATGLMLDIGTAKGFSALCMRWAQPQQRIVSVDVIDPLARVRRNTVAEVDGYRTLAETLEPWPESKSVEFVRSTGGEWLRGCSDRISFAFVDGKHTFDAVSTEMVELCRLQETGDVTLFDDVQIPGVARAVQNLSLTRRYKITYVGARQNRRYALAVRL